MLWSSAAYESAVRPRQSRSSMYSRDIDSSNTCSASKHAWPGACAICFPQRPFSKVNNDAIQFARCCLFRLNNCYDFVLMIHADIGFAQLEFQADASGYFGSEKTRMPKLENRVYMRPLRNPLDLYYEPRLEVKTLTVLCWCSTSNMEGLVYSDPGSIVPRKAMLASLP
ncbi:uncharacterized protein ASPGLDRAFT_1040920 [Aspergillus glaucus CBS 516.65]|uniref:Uncharacterized protein n=1 Tax=Aspergillus glaucus CBS 516.65 TaxID=1160497 RepID=A0A1L9V6G6_ASPGL|nr:hypothetical protein ASPGLDRAFT_1040920 [Aspergillus glaucus CBS 516.65]OJJ79524.1 hypothetical protein ASPGLDRAFT_1040920 [Aspergillus glaucus CBS 516.65]